MPYARRTYRRRYTRARFSRFARKRYTGGRRTYGGYARRYYRKNKVLRAKTERAVPLLSVQKFSPELRSLLTRLAQAVAADAAELRANAAQAAQNAGIPMQVPMNGDDSSASGTRSSEGSSSTGTGSSFSETDPYALATRPTKRRG